MSDGEIENVRVVVRVRPLSKREIESGYQKVTTVDHEHQQITIKKPTAQADVSKSYTFDYILPEECTQVTTLYLNKLLTTVYNNLLYFRLMYIVKLHDQSLTKYYKDITVPYLHMVKQGRAKRLQ